MDDIETTVSGGGDVQIPVFDLQPLLNRIVETASIDTLVLILVIFVLIGLLVSERSRNNTLTRNYMKQSIEMVAVLSSVKAQLDNNVRFMQLDEQATAAFAVKVQELYLLVSSKVGKMKPARRTRKPTASKDAKDG